MFGLKKLNSSDLFVGLWGLYYLQGFLYPQGMINQFIQLLMILMGLRSFCQCLLMPKRPGLINASLLVIMMYMVYGTLIILFGDGIGWTTDSTYLKNSLNSLLPILFFFTQTLCGNLSEKRIISYTIVMLFVVIIFYSYFGQRLVLEHDRDENTNNIGYMFVGLIPLIYFFYRKPMHQYLLLAAMMLYIFMGMKRGAIAIGVASAIIFLYSGFKEGSKKRKTITILLSLLMVIGAVYYVEYMMNTSVYFMSRIESTLDGNSSGRDHIYSAVWNEVRDETNLLYFVFGRGANSTIRFAGNFAHQDWLETACNNGVVGVCILLNFFLAFGSIVWKSRKRLEPHYYYCFLTLLFICFAKTMFSMSIQNFDVYQAMLIGWFAHRTMSQRSYG